jgi:hypothetical protein
MGPSPSRRTTAAHRRSDTTLLGVICPAHGALPQLDRTSGALVVVGSVQEASDALAVGVRGGQARRETVRALARQ